MGDVFCSNCREPWDTYHLRHDLIWETDMPEFEAKRFNGKLDNWSRKMFREIGFEFGSSVIIVKKCSSCPKDGSSPNPNKEMDVAKQTAIDLVLGDEDLDGAESLLQDF